MVRSWRCGGQRRTLSLRQGMHCAFGRLVLARRSRLGRFREEWPGPGGRPSQAGRSSDRCPPKPSGLCFVAGSRSALHRTRMVEGTQGSHHKEGSTKMSQHTIVCAGIDTSKDKLDVALAGAAFELQVANTAAGHATLAAALRQRRVERVGIEASGGYEGAVVAHLRRAGFVVVMWQPAQVRAYATFLQQRAKNDKIDAAVIAAATAATKTIHDPPDPRLAPLAAHLTFIEQLG